MASGEFGFWTGFCCSRTRVGRLEWLSVGERPSQCSNGKSTRKGAWRTIRNSLGFLSYSLHLLIVPKTCIKRRQNDHFIEFLLGNPALEGRYELQLSLLDDRTTLLQYSNPCFWVCKNLQGCSQYYLIVTTTHEWDTEPVIQIT